MIEVVLRGAGLAALAAGVAAEVAAALPATGLALMLGACVGFYLWFLAIARRRAEPARGRKR